MDILFLMLLLICIYFINPLKNEEKLFTTPFLTVSYIIIVSYILSVLNIPMYKILYFLLLSVFIVACHPNTKKLKSDFKSIIYKKSSFILLLVIIFSLFIGYLIFPSNPATTTDIQYHSYKTKAMLEEKTIFYKTDETPYKYYVKYPAGAHSVLYFLSSENKDILSSVQFLKFYIILLFVLGFYLIGNEIKKDLGYFIIVFIPTMNIYYSFIAIILPNYLGYALMLVAMYFAIRYLKTKINTYLFLMAFTVSSITLTHTFPILVLTLYLLSSTIIYKKETIKLWISHILGGLFSILLIFQKMSRDVVNYAVSKNYYSEPLSIIFHNILAGFGVVYLYITSNKIIDNEQTFLISMVFTFLLICGIFFLSKMQYGKHFVLLLIFLVLNIINIKFMHIPIPFFSSQYDSARMSINIQIIMPILYGAGLYHIFSLIRNMKIKTIFLCITLVFIVYASLTNYDITSSHQKKIYVIHNNDLKIFEYMNNHNITNETILNFGEDAGQFLPIYTKNKPVFYYYKFQSNNATVGNTSFDEIIQSVDDKNYAVILNVCKKEDIKYIYMSEYMGKYDRGFFENKTYFEIICKEGNAKLVKIK